MDRQKVRREFVLGHREVDAVGPAAVAEARGPSVRAVHRRRDGPIGGYRGRRHRRAKVDEGTPRAKCPDARKNVRFSCRRRPLPAHSIRLFATPILSEGGRESKGSGAGSRRPSARTVGLPSRGRPSTRGGDRRIAPRGSARPTRSPPALPDDSPGRREKKDQPTGPIRGKRLTRSRER